MRVLPFLALLALLVYLSGCGPGEHSRVPEPVGEWVPANPPHLRGNTVPGGQPLRLSIAGQDGPR